MADQPYAGAPVTIKLPVPLDAATLDVWAGQLERQAFVPLAASINSIIRYLNGDSTPPVPIVPPTVAIASPRSGAILQGNVTVSARANGITSIASVIAYIGNDRLGALNPTNSGTWVLPAFDSSRFPDGSYLIAVQAVDSLGNTGRDTITVLFSNTTVVMPTGDILTTESGEQLTTETGDVLLFDTNTSVAPTDALTTETGDPIATESGDTLIPE